MKASTSRHPGAGGTFFRPGRARVYSGRALDQIAFPLGGIGTGMISLGGWGQLRDFEIFNRPHKGLMFDYTFFTLFCRKSGGEPVTRVVQGPVGGDNFTCDGFGPSRLDGAGLPHFRSVEFTGAFPFARLRFSDPKVSLEVSIESYNPFIPLNPDDSGLPVAIFLFHLRNPSEDDIEAVLFANMENKTGYPDVDGGLIEYFERGGVRGLQMSTRRHPPESPRHGTLALATPHSELNVQTNWYRGTWFDNLHRFWDQAKQGELEENRQPAERQEGSDIGSIALRAALAPGQEVRLPIWIAWHNPNFEMYWSDLDPKPVWKNHYATLHQDAVAVAEYVARHSDRLEKETRLFADALFGSTLPEAVLDAVSSQISILKTTTCIRLEDGTFWAWEGCHPDRGCCEGTCSHVWNYAQALAYLFPTLERSIREADYAINLHDDGHMTFRMPLPLNLFPEPNFHAAADGQMGGVLKVYREWQLSGDDDWLRTLWPSVQKALEYAWRHWDRDRDGVMEGVQHNTYDIEFYGPNTMMGTYYLAALRAAEEMARHLGSFDKAEEYRGLYEDGRNSLDKELFNGEYYVQSVRLQAQEQSSHDPSLSFGGQGLDPGNPNFPRYQYGDGCLSDQLIGQWYARMLGLGELLDPPHVKAALASVFKYNWKPDLSEHANPQRIYALNSEAGLLLATWPRGGRPALPFPYSDEVWCGIEYQVAGHLIYEGFLEEGLAIVQAVRDRHDGARRNPWNEFECGSHYARSMASYALLLALSDVRYSAPAESLHFAPRLNAEDFACFFSVNSGWGMVKQLVDANGKRAVVELLYGELRLHEIDVALELSEPQLTLAGTDIKATAEVRESGTKIRFSDTVFIRAGEALMVAERSE